VGVVVSVLTQGDKFLLPVTFKAYMRSPSGTGNRHAWLSMDNGRILQAYAPEIHTLIPANRLTDLEAENAKLRSALKAIRDMLDSPDPRRHRDITPEMIYRTAVKALDGDNQ
jgi:hypothetical protein